MKLGWGKYNPPYYTVQFLDGLMAGAEKSIVAEHKVTVGMRNDKYRPHQRVYERGGFYELVRITGKRTAEYRCVEQREIGQGDPYGGDPSSYGCQCGPDISWS